MMALARPEPVGSLATEHSCFSPDWQMSKLPVGLPAIIEDKISRALRCGEAWLTAIASMALASADGPADALATAWSERDCGLAAIMGSRKALP